MADVDAILIKVAGRGLPIVPPFTNRELHLIKQIAGIRAGEIFDAFESGDNDVLVALAHIGARRAGVQRPSLDELWDLPAGEIVIEAPEDDEDPTSPPSDADGEPGGNQETTQPPAGDGSTAPSST